MRAQLLDAGVGLLDGVVFTHAHADHLHGIDDLRMIYYSRRARLPVWADAETSERADLALRLRLRPAAGQRLSADPRAAADRRPLRGRGAGRRHRLPAVPGRARAHPVARLPHRRPRLPAGRLGHPRRRLAGARRPRHPDHRRAALPPAPDPRPPGADARLDRPRRAAPRDPDQHAQRPRLRPPRRRDAARTSRPPMTG